MGIGIEELISRKQPSESIHDKDVLSNNNQDEVIQRSKDKMDQIQMDILEAQRTLFRLQAKYSAEQAALDSVVSDDRSHFLPNSFKNQPQQLIGSRVDQQRSLIADKASFIA